MPTTKNVMSIIVRIVYHLNESNVALVRFYLYRFYLLLILILSLYIVFVYIFVFIYQNILRDYTKLLNAELDEE